ncbi:hypothetical protein [Litchfieldia alkalitelluris]|uniref:hypothetical protein n=1 Tax=Litchfieldia alkalitelluris TaxID=304268 RepID=UPI00099718B3|nr:hypothetical protein [Litchfieldia alkalitelluris]
MITVKNAESYLKSKIGENAEDLKYVWNTFKAFSKEKVEGEEDKEILFQCGVYDFTGEELFYFDFVRQFTAYEDNDYSHMEQLHCEFLFKAIDELKKLEVSEWSMDYDNIDEFFIHVESLQEFKLPLRLQSIKSQIY